jgi:hypothetical protein
VVAALALAAWTVAGSHRELRAWLEGPEAGVRRALVAVPLPVALAIGERGGALRLDRLRLRDPLVTLRDGRAEVVAVADAEGALAWRDRPVAVSYLGRERLVLVRRPGAGWTVEGSPVPRLTALLATLSRRADAFEDGDAEAYRPLVDDGYRGAEEGKAALLRRLASDLGARPRAHLRPLAWQVRIERETAQVGEDYEIAVGGRPARRLRARLDLREEGGRWRFTEGL